MRPQNPTILLHFLPILTIHSILFYSLILFQPTISTTTNNFSNETDRISLLKFKESISNDPNRVLSSWNESFDFCEWPGISCSLRHQRVEALDLHGSNLRGTISPYVGNLTFLKFINLQNNSFSGEIPPQVSRLYRLQHLNLSNNLLRGKIPLNLSQCTQLRILSLKSNRLEGHIPSELGFLPGLTYLNLASNNLTGRVPASLGNVTSLEQFSLAYNNLEGIVPDELGRLKRLTFFSIGPNNLSGTIPISLYNISSLITFSLVDNEFSGSLPSNLGLTSPNLESFGIGGNQFSGVIPESFSNASQLQILDIAENNFFGQVPRAFGNLPNLRWLGLSNNNIGNYSFDSLDFIDYLTNCSQLEILDLSLNNFGGVLPHSMANLSTQLNSLYLGVNQISGTIPSTLENLVNLVVFGITDNLITGVIPDSLGNLQSLQILDLEWNNLSGSIPSSIGNLSQMFQLYLSHNRLEGKIPPEIRHCQNLQLLDVSLNRLTGAIPREVFSLSSLSVLLNLSRNSFSGSLPVELGNLKNLNALDLSENNLTNEIPESIGECQTLEFLYLQGNRLFGSLPSSLLSLKGLQVLDLSRNNLSGEIPEGIQRLFSLQYLNLSFNNLEGEVPKLGVFQNSSAVSLSGNTKLCGGVKSLQLRRCQGKSTERGKRKGVKLIIIVTVCVAVLLLLLLLVIFLYPRKKPTKESSDDALSKIGVLEKVEYKELYRATNGFSPNMLIGTGSFASVYKGNLENVNNVVAIKVLNLRQKGAEKSFVAECNALRNIRHRNLVKILTCCSGVNYNGDVFKALVFEYMSNGSLESWLQGNETRPRRLNFLERLNITIDVAAAMYYLHDQSHQPVLHCDLKPSNVLLDSEMTARVSDFGLARLISDGASFSGTESSTIGFKGTIGYAAPEYGMGGKQSKQGDVYSYGILVLEMFTGKRPTDEMFSDVFDLRGFVEMALPERLLQIVDPRLGKEEKICEDGVGIEIDIGEEIVSADVRMWLVSVLEIGLACSADAAKDRMSMRDVTGELQRIKDAYQRQSRV